VYNHFALRWQFDYAGAGLINKRLLVCDRCEDAPQNQLRAIVVPADPMPIQNPRVPNFAEAESNTRVTSGLDSVDPITGIPVPRGNTRTTQDDDVRVTQTTGEPPNGLNQQPGTSITVPDDAGGLDPGLPYDFNTVPDTGPLS
jgi:hypothetical protein